MDKQRTKGLLGITIQQVLEATASRDFDRLLGYC
jgi:hypothetical protein